MEFEKMTSSARRVLMPRRSVAVESAARLRACGLLFCAALVCRAESPFSFVTTPGRLPEDVVPAPSRIDLVPDFQQLKFTGREEIDVDVRRATDVVTVNAVNLGIEKVALVGDGAALAAVSLDAQRQTATFRFAHALATGRHTLSIAFSGRIPATPEGIYYNDYRSAAGTDRMLVSQFEATDARRMFPGWDEPVFKATFELSVVLPADLTVVSNTPPTGSVPAGVNAGGIALKKTSFARTPRMSTYLLVLCAGHLNRITMHRAARTSGFWPSRARQSKGARRSRPRSGFSPITTIISACPIRCRSLISSPSRVISPPAPWRIGAASLSSTMHCW